MTGNNTFRSALSYAKRGWYVFPLQGKIPLKGSKGFHEATINEKQIWNWFSNSSYNIGIATGKISGFFVLDVDNKPHKGKHGDDELKDIESKHEKIPDTVESITPSGGRHIFFKYPTSGIGSTADFRNGLDVRGDGGYIVAPPSILDDKNYEWEASSHPDDTQLAHAPEWLLSVMKEKKKVVINENADKPIMEGSRNATLTSNAGLFHSKGIDKKTIFALISNMNKERCNPPLPDKEIETIINSVTKYTDEKNIFMEPLTDTWNAKAIHLMYGKDLKYCDALRGWFHWNTKFWEADEKYKIYKIIQSSSNRIISKASTISDDETRKKVLKHAINLQNEPKMKNAMNLLRAEPEITKTSDEFDSNPWVLNCQNGTLNLETDDFYQQRREDFITKCIRFDFDPKAECPEWHKFIRSIFMEDDELIKFIQRAVGYSLSGNVSEDCIFMFYGDGANGKSTFLKHILKILGPYAITTPADTLLEKKGDAPLNDIARLKGHRFVSCVESGRSRYMDEARVKQMTGGDPIPARFLYKEYFEFYSTFKIFFATNNLPNVSELSNGIWRRLFAIPFNNHYLKDDIDHNLDAKLSAEYPGILNWAIKGFQEWKLNRLGTAATIQDFTQHYREDSDIIQIFLDEMCDHNFETGQQSISATDLWRVFSDWNKEIKGKQYKRREFNDYLKSKGFVKKKNSSDAGKYHFYGISVKNSPSKWYNSDEEIFHDWND